jgi:hypothetical protein
MMVHICRFGNSGLEMTSFRRLSLHIESARLTIARTEEAPIRHLHLGNGENS